MPIEIYYDFFPINALFMFVLMYFAWMSFSLNLSFVWLEYVAFILRMLNLSHTQQSYLFMYKQSSLEHVTDKKIFIRTKKKKNLLFAHITALMAILKKFC